MPVASASLGAALRRPAGAQASLSGKIADERREQIVTFLLKPFQALSEKRLSEVLGVSRTPVREALARLATQRLVDIYPQRGTIVAPLRMPDLERAQVPARVRILDVDGRKLSDLKSPPAKTDYHPLSACVVALGGIDARGAT